MIPTLPPKVGYIEIDTNGVRSYQKIETEIDERITLLEQKSATLEADNTILKSQYTELTKETMEVTK
jgi:uncharacterized protein YaaN involved in tellurite resistance